MGFDVSYHPISEDEVQHWYFDVLEDQNIISNLAEKFDIHPFYQERYKEFIQKVKNEHNHIFEKHHGFNIAIVQGFVRKYFYTRGSAFSFIIEQYPEFKEYTKNWQDILKDNFEGTIHNQIFENYSSGVFIPNDKVEKLLNDYEHNENVRNILDEHYSHKRISVFLNALKFAQENNLGLLEATEVITPDPLDLNNSSCCSNLFNCDVEGALLYQEAVFEQLSEALPSNPNSETLITEVEHISLWQKIKNFFK